MDTPLPKTLILVALFVTIGVCTRGTAAERLVDIGTYHDYAMMTSSMKLLCERYPNMTHLYSIGESVEGRSIWVLAIASSSPESHVVLRPEVKYVGNIHGNEVIGREILLHFAEALLANYGRVSDVTRLLENTRVHILPALNLDGSELSTEGQCFGVTGRSNAKGFDLNRNFPDFFEGINSPIQKETQAVMDWLEKEHFVLSAHFHGGALVVTYPLDNLDPAKKKVYFDTLSDDSPYSACSDDDVFRFLALTYSANHRRMPIYMETTRYANFSPMAGFKDGISNGADWYAVAGGMQDYNYFAAGCFEVTIELGACKHPDRGMIQQLWEENERSLLEYLKQVHRGVKGVVADVTGGSPISGASVRVHDRTQPQATTQMGEFWMILLPGSYTIEVSKPGFLTELLEVEVEQELYRTTRLDVQLRSSSTKIAPSIMVMVLCVQSVFSSGGALWTSD